MNHSKEQTFSAPFLFLMYFSHQSSTGNTAGGKCFTTDSESHKDNHNQPLAHSVCLCLILPSVCVRQEPTQCFKSRQRDFLRLLKVEKKKDGWEKGRAGGKETGGDKKHESKRSQKKLKNRGRSAFKKREVG